MNKQESLKSFLKNIFYSIGGSKLVQVLMRPWQGPAAILCYHRIVPDSVKAVDKSPLSGFAVSNTHFKEQMRFLSENYHLVTMDGLVDHLESGSNDFVVAVTFDDGYKDNLTQGLPILEKHGIPATIYITTRFPEGDNGIWWYELWDELESRKILEINFSGKKMIWNLENQQKRVECYISLKNWFKRLDLDNQLVFMEIVCGTKERRQYPSMCLTWEEIQTLNQHPLITIGAHTHSHHNLMRLEASEARKEIMLSKNLLENYLGETVKHFAYPFGGAKAADQREYKMVRECGFSSACTIKWDTMLYSTRWNLPRFVVANSHTPKCSRTQFSGIEHMARRFWHKLSKD